ncbi:HNH endonuclease [Phenylobacterium sp.]|uniref:HNH endonuclease n=1 Tax=Phenylobacterium sp. TaxID=1871053 RepID=UPI003001C347
MTGRSVPEWIGKTPDAKIPPRVRLRVFERHGGRCHLSGRKIMPGDLWDCDHIVALINGGEHREFNLAPALRSKHREKTAEDVAEKSKTYRIRAKHTGVIRPKGFGNRSRKFNGEISLTARARREAS